MADEIKRTNTPTPTKQQPDLKKEKQVIIFSGDKKGKIGTMNDDGTISFRKGGRVCKLAKRGKGRAYGNNS